MDAGKRMVDQHVAVYWDFENIHASLYCLKHGKNTYRKNHGADQEKLVDIASIMDYIAGLGTVNINKAYGNWSFFHKYQFELQEYAVDLVQLFPRGSHGKNGADIRLAMDVIEDVSANPHLSVIVVIGGDSDYIAIAQKVRQRARQIVGIGVQEFTNAYWVKSCNEFKFYTSLLVKSAAIRDLAAAGYDVGDLSEARQLLIRAIQRATEKSGETFILKAALKPMMMKLDPSFDEGNFGFVSFSEFLKKCADTVKIEQGKHDYHISLKATTTTPVLSGEIEPPAHPYERILKKQQIVVPDPKQFRKTIEFVFNVFQKRGHVSSYQACSDLVLEQASEEGLELSAKTFTQVKNILFKALSFRVDHERSEIRLDPEIDSAEALYYRALRTLTQRIMDNIDPQDVDPLALSRIFWGDTVHESMARELIDAYRNQQNNHDDR